MACAITLPACRNLPVGLVAAWMGALTVRPDVDRICLAVSIACGGGHHSVVECNGGRVMYPRDIDGTINWARAHRVTFEENLAILQLTQEEVDEFASLISEAEADRAAAVLAKEVSKTATATQNDTMSELRKAIGGLVAKINGTAKTSDNPKSIYNAADLPTPKTPSDLEEPPAPVNIIATFNNTDGTVSMKWANPSKDAFIGKTTFIIERRDANKHIDQIVKDKENPVSEDEGKDAQKDVDEFTKKHTAKIEEKTAAKVKEVETV